jgi:L-ascorbate metabolism protein UlaG (beta-lactamase superfamily)
MRFTHFGHACVLVETDTTRVLFDPGTLSDGFEQVTDLAAVLITHQHADHLDIERLPALFAANPAAELIIAEGSAAIVAQLELDVVVRVARSGDMFPVGGLAVQVIGGEHAVIHPDLPQIPNVGFLLRDGAFYHPGDSLVVPSQDVDVLGAPAAAPWLKLSEAVDFVRAVTPRVAIPIHEGVLARPGMHVGVMTQLAPATTTVSVLPRAESVRV